MFHVNQNGCFTTQSQTTPADRPGTWSDHGWVSQRVKWCNLCNQSCPNSQRSRRMEPTNFERCDLCTTDQVSGDIWFIITGWINVRNCWFFMIFFSIFFGLNLRYFQSFFFRSSLHQGTGRHQAFVALYAPTLACNSCFAASFARFGCTAAPIFAKCFASFFATFFCDFFCCLYRA